MSRLLAALLVAATAGAAVQSWRLQAAERHLAEVERDQATALAAALARARAVETEWADGARKAAQTYARNIDQARGAAADAAGELDRLRDALAAGGAAAAPGAAANPGADEAARARLVVGECAASLQAMAAAADEIGARLTGLQDYVQAITAAGSGGHQSAAAP